MIDLTSLLNYGVLGLWTITLLIDRYTTIKKLSKIIEDNTRAIRELRN